MFQNCRCKSNCGLNTIASPTPVGKYLCLGQQVDGKSLTAHEAEPQAQQLQQREAAGVSVNSLENLKGEFQGCSTCLKHCSALLFDKVVHFQKYLRRADTATQFQSLRLASNSTFVGIATSFRQQRWYTRNTSRSRHQEFEYHLRPPQIERSFEAWSFNDARSFSWTTKGGGAINPRVSNNKKAPTKFKKAMLHALQ